MSLWKKYMEWGRKKDNHRRGRKVAPAKIGLSAFLLFCFGVFVWDVYQSGYIGSIPLEQPVVGNVSVGEQQNPDAVAVNAQIDSDTTDMQSADSEAVNSLESTFAAYRMDREESRAEELALLQSIIDDEGGSVAIREEAEQRRLTIAEAIENETDAESLLDAKGFGETVVLVGTNQATVVCSVDLDAVSATQMALIVSETCGVNFENVVIVNR